VDDFNDSLSFPAVIALLEWAVVHSLELFCV